MFCVFCGKKIDDDAVFCTSCGKNLSEKRIRSDIEFCANCSSKIDKEAVFCTSCGSKVLEEEKKTEDVKKFDSRPEEIKNDIPPTKEESKVDNSETNTIVQPENEVFNETKILSEKNPNNTDVKGLTDNILVQNTQSQKKYGKIIGIVASVSFILIISFIIVRPKIGEYFRYEALHPTIPDNIDISQFKPDWTKFYKYARLAAFFGDDHGQLILADCYKNGIGTEQNKDKAIKYYRKAASQGNEDAKKTLENFNNSTQ